MVKTVIKIAVVALLIKELWLLLQIPSVADAVFSFVMIGQVPGTEMTLSPEQMMWLLAGMFVMASSLIFHRELMRLFRWLFGRSRVAEESATAEPATPVQTYKAPVAKRQPRLARHPFAHMASAIAKAKQRLADMLSGLAPMGERMGARVRRAAVQAWALIRKATVYAWKIALVVYILISVLAIATWRWLYPRIKKFDRWLDKKLHQNEHTAAVLAAGADIQRSIAKWWTDFKAVDDLEPPQK